MDPLSIIIGLLLGLLLGGGVAYLVLSRAANGLLSNARRDAEVSADTAIRDAQSRVLELDLQAKQERLLAKETFERDTEETRKKLADAEARLAKREDMADRKQDTLVVKERTLENAEASVAKRERTISAQENELQTLIAAQRDRLLEITGLTLEQAKGVLLKLVEDDAKIEAGEIIKRHQEHAHEEGKEKARQTIVAAIQRYAAEQTSDHTISSVEIGDDAMKGRVIGREGRNIRAFEKATGVDVIIDDTPGIVTVSCFDPVRREIARQSLEKLLQDGRIHPARIEELVVQTGKEMDENLVKLGKEAAERGQVLNLKKEILPLLGRLAYRTSYGQNVLKHSLEVAYLAQVMADELGLDGGVARRAGLLHDIGKAMDHEIEGGHPAIGADFLRRLGEPETVLNAAAGHHGDVPATTLYTPLIMAADAISASRPGRAAGIAGAIRQAAQGPRRPRSGVRGRASGVRDPGRPRDPRDRRRPPPRRPRDDEAGPRHLEEDRDGPDVPRRDQGDGAAGNP